MGTLLVTGGTGSFGQAFLTSKHAEGYSRLIVFSRDECKQAEMARRIQDDRMRYFLGDVRDVERLRMAFRGVDVVIHAAALKQVPACEYNPMEAVKTNILGTANVIESSHECGVGKVLLLSSDKAVNPVNLYGFTKGCAEKLMVRANGMHRGGTRFSCVRWGNVIGSRGSVLERVTSQGVVFRITDERMTRFWLPMEEVLAFAANVLRVMRGGEVFVPKAQARRLVDVVNPYGPPMPVMGIRPGEKIHEVLIAPEERGVKDTGWAYVIEPQDPSWDYQPWEGTSMPEGFRMSSEG